MRVNLLPSPLLALLAISGVGALEYPRLVPIPEISSSPEILGTLSRALHSAKLLGRDNKPKNTTSIAKSWDGATLFSLEAEVEPKEGVSVTGGIEVICTTCYVKGSLTTELDFDDDFDIVQAVKNFTLDLGEGIKNITTTAIDYLEDEVPGLLKNLTDDFDFSDIDLPPLNFSLNFDDVVPDIPECRLHFEFDDLELYMLLDTTISAGTSYTLNLYSSNSLIGLSKDSKNFLGVIVSIDLVLGADADIDISSGLHIQVNDGMALDLSLFGRDISKVTYNGGAFEFLPVTVQSANGVLSATLRVGLHAGVAVDSDKLGPFLTASAGTEALVYADLAEFTTNITATTTPDDDGGDDKGCRLRVQQVYQLALGAAAGATIAIGPETWGPDPETKIPIYYTTLADECAVSAPKTTSSGAVVTSSISPSTTPTAIAARADADSETTTTLTSQVVYTGIVCLSPGILDCPATLQRTTKVTKTTTLVMTLSDGAAAASFPATTHDTISKTIPFATDNVKSIAASTGAPVSYVPPPPPPPPPTPSTTAPANPKDPNSNTQSPDKDKGANGVNKGLVIGLSVGLGVPFLGGVIAGVYFCLKRRRYAAVPKFDAVRVVSPQDHIAADNLLSREKKPQMSVTTSSF